MRKLTGLGLGLALTAMLTTGFVPAADDYARPRIPTADREERGNVAYLSNFFTAITGTIDSIWDGTSGILGIVAQTVGRAGLCASDVVGLADDNYLTRPITDGFVSYHMAELSIFMTRLGNDMIEIPHGLDMSGWPNAPNLTRWGFDLPGYYHARAGGLSFADGHSEVRRWRDPRTMLPVVKDATLPLAGEHLQPNNRDIVWLQERATRRILR